MLSKFKNSTIHIIGIGGIGMSGIARILHNNNLDVQGSDLSRSKTTEELIDIGIKVFHGHHSSNVANADIVVRSSAIKDDCPEVQFAIKNGIQLLERWHILQYIVHDKHNISVTGAHGKTTTTGLLGHIFDVGNKKPNILVGGIINNFSSNYVDGQSDIFIVEADESDATFVRIPSESAIITNIDSEHLDFYKTYEAIKQHYALFIKNTSPNGVTAINFDDRELAELYDPSDPKIITYSIESADADVVATNISVNGRIQVFDLILSPKFVQKNKLNFSQISNLKLSLLGSHNISNALGAIAIALSYQISVKDLQRSLATFSGMKRRFTKVADLEGISVIDDYAHHPVEIQKTLEMARQATINNKLIVVLQPHRYTRLQSNFEEFAKCAGDANYVFVLDVFAADEKEIKNFNSQTLASAMLNYNKHAEYMVNKSELFSKIKKVAVNGDYVLFLGAGDITKTAYDFAQNYYNI